MPRTLRRTSPAPSTPRVPTINDPTHPITETSPTPRILLPSAVPAHPTADSTSAALVCLVGPRRGDPKRRSPSLPLSSCASSPPNYGFCGERDRPFHEPRDGPAKVRTPLGVLRCCRSLWPVMAKVAADVLEDPWKIARRFGNFLSMGQSCARQQRGVGGLVVSMIECRRRAAGLDT